MIDDGETQYNYDFETLPAGLRTNFAEADVHPLTPVQVEAADKLLTYFDDENNDGKGCVLVLPSGKVAEVVPLIPYILRTHSALLLVTTPKAVKDYTKAATGKDAMLITQGVLAEDTFMHPSVSELKDLFSEEDLSGRLAATDFDLVIANINKMHQPLSEVEDSETANETIEAKMKRRLTCMIAPPRNLPLDNIDLLIVDGAGRLAGNADFPGYLPELEEVVREMNPDTRVVYVTAGNVTKTAITKIIGHVRAEGTTEEDDPDGITAAEMEARILYCGESMPKSRPRTKRQRVEQNEDMDGDVDLQSVITHHSVGGDMTNTF